MEYRKLGQSDLEFSVIGIGCWVMGGQGWGGADDKDSVAAIHRAIELGINWVDTAEAYGDDNHSEKVVGEALQDRYDACMVATKLIGDISYESAKHKCEASLQRLQADVIHLYQIHWPNADVPIEETMRALVELQAEGKIIAIGVSNFDAAQLAEASQYGRIDCLQPPHNLFWRHVEKEIIPYCIENNIATIPYSPMAQGLLTGKFTQDNYPPEGDIRRKNVLFQPGVYEVALEAIEELKPLAEKYEVTLGQLALRWLIQRPGVTAPIAGARNPGQIEQSARVTDFEISSGDMAAMSAIGDRVMAALPDDSPVMWR